MCSLPSSTLVKSIRFCSLLLIYFSIKHRSLHLFDLSLSEIVDCVLEIHWFVDNATWTVWPTHYYELMWKGLPVESDIFVLLIFHLKDRISCFTPSNIVSVLYFVYFTYGVLYYIKRSSTFWKPLLVFYLHECIPTWVHTYMSAYLHECIPTWVHTYMSAYLHECIPTWVHT